MLAYRDGLVMEAECRTDVLHLGNESDPLFGVSYHAPVSFSGLVTQLSPDHKLVVEIEGYSDEENRRARSDTRLQEMTALGGWYTAERGGT